MAGGYVRAHKRRDLLNLMTEKSQSNLFVDQRTMVIVEMSLVQHISGVDIAEKLGMTQGQVSQILMAAREEYKMKTNIHIRMNLNMELQKLNIIEREAWESYYKSVGKKSKIVKRTDASGVLVEATETIEEKYGDPRYLSIIHSNMAIRHKLIGLYQPQELIVHNVDSKLKQYITEGKITFEMLENDVGREQAMSYFNRAGEIVPDIIDGEIVPDSDEIED